MLSDLEFRVWVQYQNSADDFGVMRFSPLTIQSDNAALAKRPKATIQKALAALVTVALVVRFDHQGQPFICQLDWQDFQKKNYTKHTQLPLPSAEIVARCTPATRHLFTFHPGKVSIPKFSKPFQELSENSAKPLENIPYSRETHTHTQPQTQTLPQTQPGRDEQWECFKATYPASGRQGGFMATQRFLAACDAVGYEAVMAGVRRYAASKRVKDGFVIGMEKWLEKELWIQEPDAADTTSGDVERMKVHLANIDAERAARGR